MTQTVASVQSVEIFCSYAHSDSQYRHELEIALAPLRRQGLIKDWHDGKITPGTKWSDAIRQHLESAQIILLLVSPDFVASDYAYNIEMMRALERHARGEAKVIPIIVRETAEWRQLEFAKLQVLPAQGKPPRQWQSRDAFWANVVHGIKEALSGFVSVSLPSGDNLPPPFYGELVGRAELLSRVLTELGKRFPVITIEGPAGVGKTSLAVEVGRICRGKTDFTEFEPPRFDNVVWISARDKPNLEEVLNTVARQLGYPAITQLPPEKRDEKRLELRQLLQRNESLLIIDNFDTLDDRDLAEWMSDVPEPTKVLVTSREHPLQQARPVQLAGLEERAAITLIKNHAKTIGLDRIEHAPEELLSDLVKVTSGNPQVIQMALGFVRSGALSLREVVRDLSEFDATSPVGRIFEFLFEGSWSRLTQEAKNILLAVPLFVGVGSIKREPLRAASGVSTFSFSDALEQLVNFSLLEVAARSKLAQLQAQDDEVRYVLHPMTREFAKAKLEKAPAYESEARRRWGQYYLNFVRRTIVRETPPVPYWNALVSDRMLQLDDEWPSVHEVLRWAEMHNSRLLLDLVMLLVHYMDSRLYNRERLTYVDKAVSAAEELNLKAEEALLRIDALGWTYVEESRYDKADEQIRRGLAIAKEIRAAGGNADDLQALGLAWQARVRIEEKGKSDEASELIAQARSFPANPWIETRVYMAAGDIAFKQGDSAAALEYYLQADSTARSYGGEGRQYQTGPRVALAYIGMCELDKAQERLDALRQQEKIAIGKLYADYGLALISLKRGDRRTADEIRKGIEEELTRRTSSNLLLKLISNSFAELRAATGGHADEECEPDSP